jgi:hypothetical protein
LVLCCGCCSVSLGSTVCKGDVFWSVGFGGGGGGCIGALDWLPAASHDIDIKAAPTQQIEKQEEITFGRFMPELDVRNERYDFAWLFILFYRHLHRLCRVITRFTFSRLADEH